MPELRTAQENARLEIGSQRGRNSHQIDVLGIYDLRGLSYGRTELLVADMRLLEPDPSGSPPARSGVKPPVWSPALGQDFCFYTYAKPWWPPLMAARRQLLMDRCTL